MAKGFYISKTVAVVCVAAATAAVVTIIALSVVFAREKAKNEVLVPTTAGPSTTPSTPKEPWHRYRLPDSLAPVSYNVTLWPWLQLNAEGLYIFTGNSTVIFTCVKETDLILIHSNKLNLTFFDGFHARLENLNGAPAPSMKRTWLEVPTQYLVVQLHSPLQAGAHYQLFTEFVGELSDDLGGFYRSEYVEDGVKKYDVLFFP